MTRPTVPLFLSGLLALPLAAHAQDSAPPEPQVVVTGKKAAVDRQLAKTVYDVADTPKAANGTAQDLLQSTPGLSVTADGRIAVKGQSQVTVLVDGKPSAMLSGSSDERAVVLQTMSGADIAGIEVMTNPSAAYNANGGAIVNIVLKRKRKPGAHAQVQGSASSQGLWNAGASGDLTRGNLSAHASLALRQDGTQKLRASTVDWNNPASGQSGETRQTSRVFVHRIVDSAALGLDYALSELDTLSLSGRYNARRSHPLFDVLNQDVLEQAGSAGRTIFHRISDGPNTQSDDSASLAWSHRGEGSALKAMFQHSGTVALVDKSYRDVFVEPALASAYSHGATRSARQLNQATLDWSQAHEHSQLGAGLDLQDQADDIRNYQASIDPSTGIETPSPATTNGYAVTTTSSAAYLTDQLTYGKWEALLGGRFEHMAMRLRPAENAPPLPRTQWQAFNPSVHLKYAWRENAGLTLSYRRSLQRPDARDMNPFTSYIDAQNLSRGNPGLQPQRLSSWEIDANADAGKFNGSLGAFYRATRDTVLDARSFSGDVLLTSKQNGGQGRSAGVTGGIAWTPDPKLQLGMDGGIYRVTLDAPDLALLVRQDALSAYLNLKASYSAGPDSVQADAQAQSAGMTALGRYGPTSALNLSWKHRLSSTLSLTVNANDIFDGSKRSYRVDTSTFRQAGFDHFVAQRIYIGFVKKTD